MLKMAVGHSDDVDPDDAIAAAIEQCRLSDGFELQPRGEIELKGKGPTPTCLLVGRRAAAGTESNSGPPDR